MQSSQIEEVKESIGRYAKNEGIDTIIGSTHRLNIKFETTEKIPGKGNDERLELEKAVKNRGLWDKLSELDTHALLRELKGGQFDPDIEEELRKYLKMEKNMIIHKARLKEREK